MIDNSPHVQQIVFGDGNIEIVYSEPRDIENFEKTGVLRTRVVQIPISAVDEDKVADLIDSAQQLLDAVILYERNPTVRR